MQNGACVTGLPHFVHGLDLEKILNESREGEKSYMSKFDFYSFVIMIDYTLCNKVFLCLLLRGKKDIILVIVKLISYVVANIPVCKK